MRPNAGTILFIGPLSLDFMESVAARSWRQPKALFTDEVMTDARHLLREEMDRRGFPESALGALDTGVTSQEDIADGGGRFYYFR